MQFRFSSIEKLPEAPGPATTKGSIVHRALELLFVRPAADRTPAALADDMTTALSEFATDPEYVGLRLGRCRRRELRERVSGVDRQVLRHGGPHHGS